MDKVRSRCWLGTWNNYPEDWKEVINKNSYECVAQEEQGKNAEKKHIQFAVRFENQRCGSTLKKMFPGAHLEKADNWAACKNYCRKENTRAGEQIDNTIKPRCRDPMEGRELNAVQVWMKNIIDSEPDDRSIYWLYDPHGCSGKTTYAKHLCITRKDIILLGGKSADMKYGVQAFLEKPANKLHTVLMNISRACEEKISYTGMEEVKDGMFFSTKYKCGMVIFDNPHIIVLANRLPDEERMTADHWLVYEKLENGIVIPYEKNQKLEEPEEAIYLQHQMVFEDNIA